MSSSFLCCHRRSRLGQRSACALLVAVILQPALHAQDRPIGSLSRFWLSAGVGFGQEEVRCTGCPNRGSIGGLAVTASAGVTLPLNTGIAIAVHRFKQISLEYPQDSRYLLILGQYDPSRAPIVRRVLPGLSGVTINAGLGHGRYWSDDQFPFSVRGSGLIGSAGIALRVPASSVAAFSVSASYLGAFTGTREQPPGSGTPPLRSRTLLITASLSLAERRGLGRTTP